MIEVVAAIPALILLLSSLERMRSTLISRRAGDLEAAPFHDLFSDRNCRRHVRLVVRARLDHVRTGALVVLVVSADIRPVGRSFYEWLTI